MAEDLVPAAVGQDRSVPGHETVQAAQPAYEFVPGPQIQVVGIRQNDARAEVFEPLLGKRFHGTGGSDRHKDRCLNFPVCRPQHAPAGFRLRIPVGDLKTEQIVSPLGPIGRTGPIALLQEPQKNSIKIRAWVIFTP